MGDRPIIYVSAVAKELASAREQVARTLKALGYEAIWENVTESETADQRSFLERKLEACSGVVQLVGRCYGSESSPSERPGGRVSYTQFEAHYARQCGKQVWYLMLDRTFPTDPHEQESREVRALQASYFRRVRGYRKGDQPIRDVEALTERVYALRNEFDPLRRAGRIWAAAIVFLIILIIGGSAWFLQHHHSFSPAVEIEATRR